MLPYLVFCVERAEELDLLFELGASCLLLLYLGFHVADLYFQRLRILLTSPGRVSGVHRRGEEEQNEESNRQTGQRQEGIK